MKKLAVYFIRKWALFGLSLWLLGGGGLWAGGEVVKVGWNASGDPGVMGYRIEYGKVSGSYDVRVDVGNQLEGILVGLEEGERYFVVVVAYGSGGVAGDLSEEMVMVESAPSDELEVAVAVRAVGGDELGIRKLTRREDGRVTLKLAVGADWFTGGALAAGAGVVWVEKSDNLKEWKVMGKVESGGVMMEIDDVDAGGVGRRFYRFRVGN